MRRLFHILCAVCIVGCLGLTSCATVLHGSGPQGVTITSEPPDAQVTITNLWTRHPVLQATTPVVAPLARHAGYMQPARYQVVVEKPGYEPYVLRLQADLDKRYFGNVVAGGPIGLLIVDPLTGAMYDLPPRIHAVLARADGVDVAPYPPAPPPYPPPFPDSPVESPPGPYESPDYRTPPSEERVR